MSRDSIDLQRSLGQCLLMSLADNTALVNVYTDTSANPATRQKSAVRSWQHAIHMQMSNTRLSLLHSPGKNGGTMGANSCSVTKHTLSAARRSRGDWTEGTVTPDGRTRSVTHLRLCACLHNSHACLCCPRAYKGVTLPQS